MYYFVKSLLVCLCVTSCICVVPILCIMFFLLSFIHLSPMCLVYLTSCLLVTLLPVSCFIFSPLIADPLLTHFLCFFVCILNPCIYRGDSAQYNSNFYLNICFSANHVFITITFFSEHITLPIKEKQRVGEMYKITK